MKRQVVVIGAGIIGMASAYYLQKNHPELDILVIEKNGDVGQESTAKSAAMFRNIFSSRTNQLLAGTSIDFYLALQEEVNVELKLCRYLWLLNKEQFENSLKLVSSMLSSDIGLEVLGREELKKSRVNLEVEGDEEAKIIGLKNISKGLLGKKCGSLDPYLLTKFYKEEFERLGGEVVFNTKVEKLMLEPEKRLEIPKEPRVWQKARFGGVLTDKCGQIEAEKIILVAGALANELLDPVGVDSHMRPKKRQLSQIRGPALDELLNIEGFNQEGTIPFTILPTGAYIKPVKKEKCFWVAYADKAGRGFSTDTTPEKDFYRQNIYPVLVKYFPQFSGLRVQNVWAGSYAYNTIDGIPYIFEQNGVIIVTGCSGSGLMKADALGRLVAGLFGGRQFAELFGGVKFRVSDLGVEKRNVVREEFII